MEQIEIRGFTLEDDKKIVDLFAKTPMRGTFSFILEKESILDQAGLYDETIIAVAIKGFERVGVVCGAIKSVLMNNEKHQMLYLFNLRVHPEYQRKGLAKRLISYIGQVVKQGYDVDLVYTMIERGNNRAHKLFDDLVKSMEIEFGKIFVQKISSQYGLIYPIYKNYRVLKYRVENLSIDESIAILKRDNASSELRPSMIKSHSYYRGVYRLKSDIYAHIWDSWDYRKEKITGLPMILRLLRLPVSLIRRVIPITPIPKIGNYYRTWYVFDLHSDSVDQSANLIKSICNEAKNEGIDMVMLLFRPHIEAVVPVRLAFTSFDMDVYLLSSSPIELNHPVYLDIRDI